MSTSFATALLITAVGMSLVFGAILLFWLVMSILVRLTSERNSPSAPMRPEYARPADRHEQKRRAAVAAVAAVLAQEACPASTLHAFPLPSTATVSAWQAVMRSRQLKQRGPVR